MHNCSAAAERVPNWTGHALNSSYVKDEYPLSQNDYRQENYFRIIVGGSTGKIP